MKKFIIKSTDNYGEKNFEIVSGELQDQNDQLIYKYTSKLGKCKLIFSKRKVSILRQGEVFTKIDIDLDKKTEFCYVTKEIKKYFEVVGEEITIDREKKISKVSYKIYEGIEELNKITVAIRSY